MRTWLTVAESAEYAGVSREAAKWEEDLAEIKKTLHEVPQKRHKRVESTEERRSEKTATAR